ncbi:MAG: hypothetical protein IPM33_08485 [Phycisphaerales bacterium]|nr:hypothetical protein [Phycisphaerales bacterium]
MPTVPQNPGSPKSPRRLRTALLVPIVVSVLVHAGIVAALVRVSLSPPRTHRLVDAPSVLTLAPARDAGPVAPPTPEPPAPAESTASEPIPEPSPEPSPEPIAPAPVPVDAPPDVIVEPMAPPALAEPTPPAPPEPLRQPAPRAVVPPPPEPIEAPAGVVFAGEEARAASRIVYVIDGSGAMVTSLEFVRREVAASVGRLSPSQRFDVIVFRDTGIERFDAAGRATPERKARLGVWLGAVEPQGRSDPLVGLKAAADLDPELVFFLTRSIPRSQGSTWGPGREATLTAMETLNPRRGDQRRFVVKVVQFLDPDPTGLLPALANTHGDGPGSYRVIRREDLR